ncbi:MAG TPA: caspase family protein [Candidatus Limnocylindrales bacterium]|nr:caspase family protein [Candidatus Limnocylindrales bacterium]
MTRKAFLVGINRYPDPRNNLKGCVNDVLLMAKTLREQYGFAGPTDIKLLTDERATTANIRNGLEGLVASASPGDSFVFHYSGHGAQVRDVDGDELSDSLDEILCPYDLDWNHPFTDDDLAEICRDLPKGTLLTVILDCCHSGTGLRNFLRPDLPIRYKFLPAPVEVRHRSERRIENRGIDRSVTMIGPDKALPVRRFGISLTKTNAVLIAGCRSDQTSADAWIDGDYHGALTYYLWRSLRELNWKGTYRKLIFETGAALADHNFDQVPQLEGPARLISSTVFIP